MKCQELKTLNHCVYNIQFHLIFVTKYRKKVISQEMLTCLHQIFSSVLTSAKCNLIEFNGESDHVHLLMSLRPDVTPSKIINVLKSVSSRKLRTEFSKHISHYYWKPVFWSKAYCIISVGGAPIEILKRYIQEQARPK